MSAVPSKPASGETPKEQPSESAPIPPGALSRRRRERQPQKSQQGGQPPQNQQQLRPPAERTGPPGSELPHADRANRRSRRQPAPPPESRRRPAQPEMLNLRQFPLNSPPDAGFGRGSSTPTPGALPPRSRPDGNLNGQSSPQAGAGRRSRKAARPNPSQTPVQLNPQNSVSGLARSPRKAPARQTEKSTSPLVYGLRLLILGVGIGVIAGTLLSMFDPASRYSGAVSDTSGSQPQQEAAKEASAVAAATAAPAFQLTAELTDLKMQLQALAAQNPDLAAGAFFADLDTGAYIDLNGSQALPAASTIKLPILIAFFQDVDAGKISLEEPLTLREEDIAEGSGDMQYDNPGRSYTALETATKMIAISDNTATNMLIERLGGAETLNQRFASWGLTETAIRNKLPDLEGTNTTSPKDLGNLMAQVNQGELVSLRSRDRLLGIMQRTENNTLLPQGLGEGATIAHKTGTIASMLGDAGIVDLPTGKRYIAAVMVKRPDNDPRAEELIRQFSRKVYLYFSNPGGKS
ncbi:serine hydrolase [Kamptonema formosum]|uniref:serine hydrolase n=1 Tax=Kamptonema formosum TaxID=331992 RepID=UPI001E3A05DF|nr:serine hydrolase [Oscillatoria sp. PCC 10802]